MFVRAGGAEFFRAKTDIAEANGIGSSRSEGSRQSSETGATDAAVVAAAGAAAVGPSVAVVSGLTFKGQFLRLVLWEAAGSSDNPGRQVGGRRILYGVSGSLICQRNQNTPLPMVLLESLWG